MPPPPKLQQEAAESLAALKLESFSAEPGALLGGQSVTLSWRVDTSHCPFPQMVGFYLDATRVSASQSLKLRPAKTITYALMAQAVEQVRVLREVTIPVDDSACQPLSLPASQITPQIVAGIKAEMDAYNADPSTSNKATIQVNEASLDAAGLTLNLRFGIDISDFPDPTVSIVAVIGFQVLADGSVLPYYVTFSVAVDWPWYVKVIGGVVTAIVEAFIGDEVSGKIKNAILGGLASQLDEVITASGRVVTDITTAQDELIITLCPSP
jgi:hypothetical protein